LALARVRRGSRLGVLTDAFALDALAEGMLYGLRHESKIRLPNGALRFLPTSRLASVTIPESVEIRRISAEQSNSSLIIGDTAVLKIVRHVAEGTHPEAEMTRHLTECGFANIPPLLGDVARVSEDGTVATVALLQGFVRNQGDGWTWTMDYLGRTIEELAVTGETEEEAETDAFASYRAFATAMGKRLAELHAVLSDSDAPPDFAAEPADRDRRISWAEDAIGQLSEAVRVLRDAAGLAEDAHGVAQQIIANQGRIEDAVRHLAARADGALSTRVHGDFHLGQVLVVQGDAFLIDFEGEPARPLKERREKSSPLRDVAGLLRSFDYAAATASQRPMAASLAASDRRAALLQRFHSEATECFLQGYRSVLKDSEFVWTPESAFAPLLDLFLLQKAAYEVRYEAANRPTWLGIPTRGLAEISARLLAEDEGA
jgi:maltose alpha-D-glucosyltransferase/alpha-amylase